jgi:Xaa-Pro dipeptidase
LQYYYPVGGVRIEDDILVTQDGFENLTTAPKGQAALDIINGEDEKPVGVKKRKGWFW